MLSFLRYFDHHFIRATTKIAIVLKSSLLFRGLLIQKRIVEMEEHNQKRLRKIHDSQKYSIICKPPDAVQTIVNLIYLSFSYRNVMSHLNCGIIVLLLMVCVNHVSNGKKSLYFRISYTYVIVRSR